MSSVTISLMSSSPLHILFLSLTASGHTNPQLPLVAELVNRGHQITYICGEQFRVAIEKAGARWVPGSDPTPLPDRNDPAYNDLFTFFNTSLVHTARHDYAVFHEELAGEKFDLIAHGTFSLTGRVLSHKYEIPAVQLWASAAKAHARYILAIDNTDPDILPWDVIDNFFIEHSLTSHYRPSEYTDGYNISFIPPFFQPNLHTLGDNFHCIGPSIGSRSQDTSWNAPDDPRPLIFISLGTVFHNNIDFFRDCISALNDKKYQIVMAIGDQISPQELGSIPDNFTIASFFPQPKVLQHAHAFVSHAGMNSSMEALYYNVPTVLYPQSGEQKHNAQRLVELGCGKILSPDNVARELPAAIDTVLTNPSYTQQSRIYGEKTRSLGGAALGADIMERIATQNTISYL